MEATEVTVEARRRRRLEPTRTIYSTEYGPDVRRPRRHPAAVDGGLRLRARRRQRDQLPLPQPLPRQQPGPVGRRVRPRSSAATRASPGSTRSPPTARATPTTRCRARSRTSTDEHAAECNVARAGLRDRSACRSSTARARTCNWETSPDAVAPGTFPPDEVPTLFRPDYVHNGNDSHWLTNPEAPLTGFDRIIGIEDAERTTADPARADPGRGPPRRHRRPARQPVQPQRSAAGRARQPPVPRRALARRRSSRSARARPAAMLLGSSGPVDVSGACDAAGATGTCATTSTRPARSSSAASPRNLLDNFQALPDRPSGRDRAGLGDALHDRRTRTPTRSTRRAASTSRNPLVGSALADAVTDLEGAGIPLDAPLRRRPVRRRAAASRSRSTAAPAASASSTRSTRPGTRARRLRRRRRTAPASSWPRSSPAGKCPVDAGTFVTYGAEREPALAARRRLHAGLLAEALEPTRPSARGDVRRQALDTERLRIRR